MVPQCKKEYLDKSIIKNLDPIDANVSNYEGYGNTYCYKLGTKVHLHIGAKINTTSLVKCYKLPENYYPVSLIGAIGIANTLTNMSGIQIWENGEIQIETPNKYCLLDIEFDTFK